MTTVAEVIAALRVRGEASANELASQLGISQPTILRLLAGAGERVCRLGRRRGTRYALTRSIPTLGNRLPVREVDETGKIRPYGLIHLLAQGRHWLERENGRNERFEGLPHFAQDMSPQGYIGRSFPAIYPELELPPRIRDWNDDHRLTALARRGEDCVGNLIIGDESFSRFLAGTPQTVQRDAYPELARRSLEGMPGSSAGGEQPKFAVYADGRHVLVKFASGEAGSITERWQDLLVCEREALEAVRQAGIQAALAKTFDVEGARFLEVERFDRCGLLGRKGLLSLFALGTEYLGYLENWTKASRDLLAEKRIDAEDARRIRWLDAFGQLIGNNDRHFGNLSFFREGEGTFRLAPAYDMLPMIFSPEGTNMVERRFEPRPPSAENFDVWADAARQASAYWDRLSRLAELSGNFRERCSLCREAVTALASRVPGM